MRIGHRKTKLRLFFGGFYIIFVALVLFFANNPLFAEAGTETLNIEKINLATSVIKTNIESNGTLKVPDQIAAAYTPSPNKIFLYGHSTTVFKNLKNLSINDEIIYDGQKFNINSVEIKAKAEIDMKKLLASESEKTVIIMTCHGQNIGKNDYSHRLIIRATADN